MSLLILKESLFIGQELIPGDVARVSFPLEELPLLAGQLLAMLFPQLSEELSETSSERVGASSRRVRLSRYSNPSKVTSKAQ